MKILLIVLASLTSALSKPAILENHLHGFETTLNLPGLTSMKNFPSSKTQEPRTAYDDTEENFYGNNERIISPMEKNSVHEIETPKKMGDGKGLRVYRNSGDEDALNDLSGRCKKQVQLKVCEDESDTISQMRHDNTKTKAPPMTKEQLEQRIKMATEALEHIKKYLREENSSKIKVLDSREEIQNEQKQQDELEAFQSIVDDFSNLQSMNLSAISKKGEKLNDATKLEQSRLTTGDDRKMRQLNFDVELLGQVFDDYAVKMRDLIGGLNRNKTNTTKPVESRMDQWKDNIDKTKKNAVTGINIEDRFKNEKDNDDIFGSFQSTASEIEDTPLLKSELMAVEGLNKNNNEEFFLNNNEEHEGMVMTQDIKSNSNLHSDSLRLESGSTHIPESSKFTSNSDLTSTEQRDVLENNDLKKEHVGNENIGRTEYITDMTSREESPDEIIKSTTQKQAEIKDESEVKRDDENVLQKFKSMTDLIGELSNLDHKKINENVQNENTERLNKIDMSDSDAMMGRIVTENDDFNRINKHEGENVQLLQSNQQRSEIHHESNENAPEHEHTSLFAEERFNTAKSLTSVSDNKSPISIPSRDSAIMSDNTSNFPFQFTRTDDRNRAHEFVEILNTPRWLTHTNNEHMKTVEDDNNEAAQASFNQHNHDLVAAKTVNDIRKTNEPSFEKLNRHGKTEWTQIRDAGMVMPQTLPNVNMKQNIMAPSIHSDGSEMMRYDRNFERNNLNGIENTQWMQKLSAHENPSAKPFGDRIHNAFRAHHPGWNFKNSETNPLKSDSRLTKGRFANDGTNLHDNSLSSVMIPVYHERMDDGDSMVQASEQIRQLMQKSAADYAQSWYNTHGMTRGSSYNQEQVHVPSNGGSGAVGLFPTGNTKGCAIPLLVSCSPSVVSGTLANGQPSYNTHSYQSMDNYKYHKKRETKKGHGAEVNKTSKTKVLKKIG